MKKYVSFVLAASVFMCCAGAYAEKAEYGLHPTDVITITVHGQPDLTTKTRVTADGYITFPLLGKVSVAGLTVPELEQKLKESLEKDYLVNAQVLIFIEEYNARQVSVLGEVKSPGKYALPGEKEMTLMQAIAMAGGFTKFADLTKTKVMRAENGEKKTIVINVKSITEKGDKDQDIILRAEDIVVVPESFF